MNRTTILYLALLLGLGTIAILLLLNKKNGTIPVSDREFSVKDTAGITKIMLTQKSGDTCIIVREGVGRWKLNNKYEAEQGRVSLLLETIKLVDVKNPVGNNALKNVETTMATEAVKVQIYKGDQILKTYYVGSSTPDGTGTYMFMEGGKVPFVTFIPGFDGYLTPRYIAKEIEMRSRTIFAQDPATIKEVTITYPDTMPASFIFMVDGSKFHMISANGSRPAKEVSEYNGKKFLVGFHKITFENFVPAYPQERDSIFALQPYAIIKVKTDKAEWPVLQLFAKKADKRTKFVTPGNMDGEKYYGRLGNGKEVLLVQKLVLEKIMASYDALAR